MERYNIYYRRDDETDAMRGVFREEKIKMGNENINISLEKQG